MKKTTRCCQCRGEFGDKELKNVKCCPICKTIAIPMNMSEDVTIKINWHELRVLGMWAENWARQMDSKRSADEEYSGTETITSITMAIEKQFPLKDPLMLVREINQLKQQFPGVKLTDKDGNEIK